MALDFPNTPTAGQSFQNWVYDGIKWIASSPLAPANPRNLLHNALFNVQQRGAGGWNTNYTNTADRWLLNLSVSTCSISIYAVSDAQRSQIGDEAALSMLGATFTGTAGASDYANSRQSIEKAQRLSGKTIIVSFYANASATTLRLGVSADQIFGTGGTPSAAVLGTGQAVTLASGGTFARYTVTLTLPSAAGKTFGTNGDDFTQLNFWYTSGATNNTRAGGIGVQSGSVNLWGVQCEIAQPGQTAPTPLEKLDPRMDLANCQRFYQTGSFAFGAYATSGQGVFYVQPLLVTMRAAPTVTPSITSSVNLTGATVSAYGNAAVQPFANSSATAAFNLGGTFTASADL